MSRILSTLAILCLVSVAWAQEPTSQSSLVTSSLLYSGVVQVFFGTNTTLDYLDTKPWYTVTSTNNQNVKFGPSSTTNETIYAYGIQSSGTAISGVVRRELNATTIADVTTTPAEGAVISDTSVTASITVGGVTSSYYVTAVGPGYLAILSYGTISSIITVQVTLISTSATSATPVLASTSSSSTTAVTLGNIWYDIGSGTFFFTYAITATTTNIYIGGIVASTGALYWAAPGLAILTTATSDTITSSIVSGPNNWSNSTEIIVAYKDTTASPAATYFSIITKSASTTSAGTPVVLASDVTATSSVMGLVYVPIGVWASEYTYGIATSLVTSPTTADTTVATVYSIENFLNVTSTSFSDTKDSGLTNGTSTTLAATKVAGLPLTTGFTLIGVYTGTEDSEDFATVTAYLGSFFANGTANTTITEGALLTNLAGPWNIFTDINGTVWIGWTDLSESNTNIYNLYVARLQQQIYSSESSGNALTTLMAFVAFCLVAVFAF